MKLHVIYRLCDRVTSLHGLPRPGNLPKGDLIKLCMASLRESLKPINHYVSIVGDTVSSELWDWAKHQLNPVNTFNFSEPAGDGKSLLKASEFAMTTDETDWIYLVEDDYFHDYNFFAQRVYDFINLMNIANFALPVFMHPTDYPDQYKTLKRSYVLQGTTGYWREVSSTTHTFMMAAKSYRKFVNFFRECHNDDGNDGKLSTIFKRDALCFSPLPGIATHMHEGTMGNYVNWNALIAPFFQKPPEPVVENGN